VKKKSLLSRAELDACAACIENLRIIRKFRKDAEWLPINPEDVLALLPRTISDEAIYRTCYNMFVRIQWSCSVKQDRTWLPVIADLQALMMWPISTEQA